MASAPPKAPPTALDNTDEHSTTALYRAAIGEVNTAYYLSRLTRFETADRAGLSWNWGAALGTLNWLMFRQLWHAALVYSGSLVALVVVLFGIGKLVFQFSEGMQWGLLAVLVGLAFVVPGLGGNAVYFAATRQRVKAALAACQTVPEACTMLSKQASTRKRLAIIGAGNLLILAMAAQSYSIFSGFVPLPSSPPQAAPTSPEARNMASGRATEAAAPTTPASAASQPLAAPRQSTAWSPPVAAKPAASAPTMASSAVAAPAPAAQASSPASAAPSTSPKPAPIPAALPAAVAPSTATAAVASPPKPRAVPAAATAQPAPVPLRSAAAIAAARAVAAAYQQAAAASEAHGPMRPAEAASVTAATPAASSSGRFMVNVGLFSDDNNARNTTTKLMDSALPVISKVMDFPKGRRTRIQVGPFDTLAEADAAANKVQALGLDARVAPLP